MDEFLKALNTVLTASSQAGQGLKGVGQGLGGVAKAVGKSALGAPEDFKRSFSPGSLLAWQILLGALPTLASRAVTPAISAQEKPTVEAPAFAHPSLPLGFDAATGTPPDPNVNYVPHGSLTQNKQPFVATTTGENFGSEYPYLDVQSGLAIQPTQVAIAEGIPYRLTDYQPIPPSAIVGWNKTLNKNPENLPNISTVAGRYPNWGRGLPGGTLTAAGRLKPEDFPGISGPSWLGAGKKAILEAVYNIDKLVREAYPGKTFIKYNPNTTTTDFGDYSMSSAGVTKNPKK